MVTINKHNRSISLNFWISRFKRLLHILPGNKSGYPAFSITVSPDTGTILMTSQKQVIYKKKFDDINKLFFTQKCIYEYGSGRNDRFHFEIREGSTETDAVFVYEYRYQNFLSKDKGVLAAFFNEAKQHINLSYMFIMGSKF